MMKTTTILAIALGLGSLAACNKSPTEQAADNIEANDDNTADQMEANVDNAADEMQANTENAADAVRRRRRQTDAPTRSPTIRRDAMPTTPVDQTSPPARRRAGPRALRHRGALFARQKLSGTTSRTPGSGVELLGDRRRDRVVDRDQRDRLAACLAAAEVEGRDVDAVLAEPRCRARR